MPLNETPPHENFLRTPLLSSVEAVTLLSQQLIALGEKHQWMFTIVKIILLKIDIAQGNLRFFIQRCCAHRIK